MKSIFSRFRKWQKERKLRKQKRVPKVSLPYSQEIRAQRRKFQLGFLILVLVVSFYTYHFWKQYQIQEALIEVVVVTEELTGPRALESGDVILKKIPRRYLPSVFFTDLSSVEGKVLIPDVVEGEILLPKHFQGKLDPESISARFAESYAFTLDEDWLVARLPELRTNDRIDILVSNPKAGIDQTAVVAENIRVIEIQKLKDKRTLVLQMSSVQAQPVIFARGLRLPMQVLVHSSLGESTDF